MRRNALILACGCVWASSSAAATAQPPADQPPGDEGRPLVRIVENERTTWARIRRVPSEASQRPLGAPPLPELNLARRQSDAHADASPASGAPQGARGAGLTGEPREVPPGTPARRLAPRLSDLPPPDLDAWPGPDTVHNGDAVPEHAPAAGRWRPAPAAWNEPHRQPPTLDDRPWTPGRVAEVDPEQDASDPAEPWRPPLAGAAPSDNGPDGEEPDRLAAHPELNVLHPSGVLQAPAGGAIVLHTDVPMHRAEIVDDEICRLHQYTDREVALVGRRAGATYLLVWFAGQSEARNYRIEIESPSAAGSAAEAATTRRSANDPPSLPQNVRQDWQSADPILALPDATSQVRRSGPAGGDLRPTPIQAAYDPELLEPEFANQLSRFIAPVSAPPGGLAPVKVQSASAQLGRGRPVRVDKRAGGAWVRLRN